MKHGKYELGKETAPDKDLELHRSETEKNNGKESWKDIILYFHDLVYLLGIGLLVLLVCFRIVVVSGDSMKDSLLDGDYLLLLSSTFYHEQDHGDIVVISKDSFENGAPIVKRVIGVENDVIDIDFRSGEVSVNGVILEEPYISTPTTRNEGMSFPIVVPEGCIFVMGDNRFISQDSRSDKIGIIDSREVVGKAILLFVPGTDHDTVKRDFSRIGVLP